MIGRRLKNYQIEELLGEGGMGVVYRARDLNLERMVAIKMLHPEMLHQPDLLIRFRNEAHVTARLTHPNIAILYNFFTEDDLHCLVMEFVNGKTLEQILNVHKHLPENECIRLLIQLLEGLGDAHNNEILHRDIKPGNIMLNHSGYVKLMDFGVARFEKSARITRMNRVIGTLEYMAPELLTGGKPSVQADLYSAGVVAYEMYTGKLPFEADADTDLIELIMKGKYSFSKKDGKTMLCKSNKLESIISKLMQKNTSRRYSRTGEVLHDLAMLQISGRVSTELLSVNKMEFKPVQPSGKVLLPFAINAYADRYQKIAQAVYEKARPKVIEFFKTTEGKIIGGAVGIAIFIMLLASIFSGSGDQPIPGHNLQNLLNEEITVDDSANGTATLRSLNPGPQTALAGGRQPGPGGQSEDFASRPPAIVNPDDRKSGSEGTQHGTNDENREIGRNQGQYDEGIDTIEEERRSSGNENPLSRRTIAVQLSNVRVEGVFSETVSTNTHKPGDRFYLSTTRAVYTNGYRVIEPGSRIRAIVNESRKGDATRRGRAFLAVTFEAVQAVDGSWLPVSYPEYSDRGSTDVIFERGRSITQMRVQSGEVNLVIE